MPPRIMAIKSGKFGDAMDVILNIRDKTSAINEMPTTINCHRDFAVIGGNDF